MAIRDEDVGWKPRSQNAKSREALAPKSGRNPMWKQTGMMTSTLILWRNWRVKDYDFQKIMVDTPASLIF